ncbi:MAG: suppressor of glycerol defect [Icmadophila ericetorum]|nr:suppressor of glycerol defect [Icmadophila ericetorum]
MSTRTALKLPRQLLNELGIPDDQVVDVRKGYFRPSIRKERRKAARVQKKIQNTRPRTQTYHKTAGGLQEDPASSDDSNNESDEVENHQPVPKAAANLAKPKSILKPSTAITGTEPSKEKLQLGDDDLSTMSRRVKDKLAEDDAEIAALEKALGMKGKKRLPKSFQKDGLDVLLEGLDESDPGEDLHLQKRRKTDEDAWLQAKREKAREATKSNVVYPSQDSDVSSAEETDEMLSDAESARQSGSDNFEGFNSEPEQAEPVPQRVRENPYVAPPDPSSNLSSAKYVPPSKRGATAPDTEDLQRLRRQIQGLLNRLSEANLATILTDVEKLYRLHPRQHVSSTMLDLLISLLCDSTSLSDTFVILHAGFIAAMYRQMGTDVGAQVVQRTVEEFDIYYAMELGGDSNGKRLTNLISLMAELYNFKVIGSNLIFDFLRLFLNDLSEMNTELVLKIVRNAGPQLRQDDASTLKDIVFLLQSAVKTAGADSLSVRARFMVETVNDLKNNRMKTGLAASSIASEHVTRMRKILGSLQTRNAKASEPLRISLKDIRDGDKRGKWWLVGASYRDEEIEKIDADKVPTTAENNTHNNDANDLLQLARDLRMNTDIRRSIFVTIMSATDYRDAHLRLLKLRLKRTQELEIPRVLIHCARAEAVYNPYYTLIAKRLCTDKKLKMAFQFSLWDTFKLMGEGEDEIEQDNDRDDKLETREVVNLAKLFGSLVADGGLTLSIFKNLNLAYLQPQTRIFVELLLITVILQSRQNSSSSRGSSNTTSSNNQRNEEALINIFMKLKTVPEMVRGLQYFLKKVVSKTDVAGSKTNTATVKWGCRIAANALGALVAERVEGED